MDEPAAALLDGVDAALPGWVERSVTRIMTAWAGEVPSDVARAASDAGEAARAVVVPQLLALLEADIDEQRQTPLTIIRSAVRWPTAVLHDAGVPPVERDAFEERAFPEDLYGLAPATFADVSPELADLGIAWGAAKAMAHRRRHKP
jgi:hypothetical protein